MFSPEFVADLIPIILGLFLYGCGYAWAVYSLGERKAGYVALFVVVGVLVTLSGVALVDGRAALIALVCFVASGTPMVAGEIIQHMQARSLAIREHQAKARNLARGMEINEDER